MSQSADLLLAEIGDETGRANFTAAFGSPDDEPPFITGSTKWDIFVIYIIFCLFFIGVCCVSFFCLFWCYPARSENSRLAVGTGGYALPTATDVPTGGGATGGGGRGSSFYGTPSTRRKASKSSMSAKKSSVEIEFDDRPQKAIP